MWTSRSHRSFEALKPAVIAELTSTVSVVHQADNGCIACGRHMVQNLYLQKWHCGIYRDTSGRQKVVSCAVIAVLQRKLPWCRQGLDSKVTGAFGRVQ